MSYRNKTFVSFDGDTDMHYYRLMQAWKQNDNVPFDFYNAHDLNRARETSTEESIKAQLAERLRNTKVFVILIGENTRYLYKFVRWEIEQSIKKDLPIIAVNLNGKKSMDADRCPPLLRDALAVHIRFNAKIMQYALENWPDSDEKYRKEGKIGSYYYKEEVYSKLGI
ncbi:MAG: TIR domain-containing protein [Halobacteriota archaeon]|nr:TIR domain-containing protein [Halobacteriota archaeon]